MAKAKIIIYSDNDSNIIFSGLEKLGEAGKFRQVFIFLRYLFCSARDKSLSISFYGSKRKIDIVSPSGKYCIKHNNQSNKKQY